MSTYNENVQETKQETLSNLYKSQQQLDSERKSAEYGLYFSQGAQVTATDKLNKDIDAFDFMHNVQQQSVLSDNAVNNLLTTTTAAEKATATTVSNTAVAANNIQLATNAIAQLAADIGSAYNIASAADATSQIQAMTEEANNLMRTTSYHAEVASRIAMEASSDVAEIIAKQVQTETTAAKTEVEGFLTASNTQLSALGDAKSADIAALSAAKKREKTAEGTMLDSEQAYFANVTSYAEANNNLNLDLVATAEPNPPEITNSTTQPSNTLLVSLDKYEEPFAQAAKATNDSGSAKVTEGPVSGYYLVVVPYSQQATFGLRHAEALFSNASDRFIEMADSDGKVIKGSSVSTSGSTSQSDVISALVELENQKDSEGDEIAQGKQYVVFVYVELTLKYKKHIGNFDDMLTAPSLPFTFTTTLPLPTKNKEGQTAFTVTRKKASGTSTNASKSTSAKSSDSSKSGSDSTPLQPVEKISFTVTDPIPDYTEFRLMLLPKGALGFGDYITTHYELPVVSDTAKTATRQLNPDVTGDPGFYFNPNIALQVSPANYTVALRDPTDLTNFHAEINDDTTDNFGNVILTNESYIPVVVVVMPEDELDYANFASEMSTLNADAIVINPEQTVQVDTITVPTVFTAKEFSENSVKTLQGGDSGTTKSQALKDVGNTNQASTKADDDTNQEEPKPGAGKGTGNRNPRTKK